MKILCLFIFFLSVNCSDAISQKNLINNDSYKSWTSLGEISHNTSCQISDNGKYLAYKYGSPRIGDILVLRSIDSIYSIEFKGVLKSQFTNDSKIFIFLLPGDSLVVFTLEDKKLNYIKNVISFEVPNTTNTQWLIYQLKGDQKKLVLRNLSSSKESLFSSVEEYKLDDKGETLVMRMENSILWMNILKTDIKKIFSGKTTNFVFDKSFKQLAFIVNSQSFSEVRYFRKGMDSSVVLINKSSMGMNGKVVAPNGQIWFSKKGNKLFFQIEDTKMDDKLVIGSKIETQEKSMELWNYNNEFLSNSNEDITERSIFSAVTSVSNPKVVQISDENHIFSGNEETNTYGFIFKKVNGEEMYWNHTKFPLLVVNTDNGRYIKIKDFDSTIYVNPIITPDEKFVIWFDNKTKGYFSFEFNTGIIKDISKLINVSLYDDESDIAARREQFGIAGLLKDNTILVYDRYDIWKIDPSGKKDPVNITNSYGRKHHIIFRRVVNSETVLNAITCDSLLLAGFNRLNKENGFWSVKTNGKLNPSMFTMGPYAYYFLQTSRNILVAPSEYLPQKAKNTDIYIVRRMSAVESPNLFMTRDFRSYKPITELHPEKAYNWMTSELFHWKTSTQIDAEGILYKPENFDSTKKYPIIFYYYEKLSDGLNKYLSPELSNGILNIPWYVSNGYIVFVPNLYYKTGDLKNSIMDCITSAVSQLEIYSWVDRDKMGLQGHSFGGFETVTIITNTDLFCAAQESAGYVNSTSYYSYRIGNVNRNHYFDLEQGNLASTPWTRPDIFILNSPIFHVNNVQTPLLIMHNKADYNSPFSQGWELFSALRRLRKPSWLLEYENEGHTLDNLKNQSDFTVKQQQFFDHYLKNKPLPKWMEITGNDN